MLPATEQHPPLPEQNTEMTDDSMQPTASTPSHSHNQTQQIRSNAIHLTGVTDFSTNDIEKYMDTIYRKPFQVEWIDDEHLNIVYDDPDDAFEALVAITLPEEFDKPYTIAPEELRKARVFLGHPDSQLLVRFAMDTDRKEKGSRVKSRYYLVHGEPSRKEDLVRFGTRRSNKPMLYGGRNVDLVTKRSRRDRLDDLFPEKASTSKVNLNDLDDVDDLFPEKRGKNNGGRNGRGRGRGARGKGRKLRQNRDSEPDLFEHKLNSSKQQADDVTFDQSSANTISNTTSKPEDESASVYQNMDY